MVNLLFYTHNIHDATSFYRCWGILPDLREQWPELHMQQTTQFDWVTLKQHQIVFMQRPHTVQDVRIAEMAKANGKKLWIDWDEDLTIPVDKSCPVWDQYINSPFNVKQLAGLADLITVTTQHLRSKFPISKTHVVPNAYDHKLYPYRKSVLPPRTKTILWRGGKYHDSNLMEFTPQLLKAAENHPDYAWVFVGYPFWYTLDVLKDVLGDRLITIPYKDPILYMKQIYEIAPEVMIYPVTERDHNFFRSHCGWLEATHAGACYLGPDWEEFKRPGVSHYLKVADFAINLRLLLEDQSKDKYLKAAETEIAEKYRLTKVNALRKKLLLDLLR